jgi:hypothetical protein
MRSKKPSNPTQLIKQQVTTLVALTSTVMTRKLPTIIAVAGISLSVSAPASVIGTDDFSYSNGNLAINNGGSERLLIAQ